jgi:hypothetical protein
VDLAWAPDGLTLLATSTDGTIAALQFTTDDLAPLASKKVRFDVRHCTDWYRFSPTALGVQQANA